MTLGKHPPAKAEEGADPPHTPAPQSTLRVADVRTKKPEALTGMRIGRYRLLQLIATGGMAQVWLARPEGGAFSRAVAIKLVLPELAADEEYARMFIDEAMVASAIHHPNVCEIEELGREKDLLFMVLEWVPGFSLGRVLQIDRAYVPFADEIAARIIADACAGLHAAHDAVGSDGEPLNIVHRDVSPPNILISLHGTVKVSDFGIAKARNQLHARTRTGEIKGKFAYVSPERLLGRPADRRTDIYALGAILYLATLGQRPFGLGKEALPKITKGDYVKPRQVRPDYPEALEAIIVRALALDPEKRFPTALAMQLELEQWLIAAKHPTTSGDIAAVFRERVGGDGLKALEGLMKASQALPHELAARLLATGSDRGETPTGEAVLRQFTGRDGSMPSITNELEAATVRMDADPASPEDTATTAADPPVHLASLRAPPASAAPPASTAQRSPTAPPVPTVTPTYTPHAAAIVLLFLVALAVVAYAFLRP